MFKWFFNFFIWFCNNQSCAWCEKGLLYSQKGTGNNIKSKCVNDLTAFSDMVKHLYAQVGKLSASTIRRPGYGI